MEAPASGMSTESKPGVTFSLAHYQRNPSASDQPQDNLPYPSANLAYLGQVVRKVPGSLQQWRLLCSDWLLQAARRAGFLGPHPTTGSPALEHLGGARAP